MQSEFPSMGGAESIGRLIIGPGDMSKGSIISIGAQAGATTRGSSC